jgi:hypothetical protein
MPVKYKASPDEASLYDGPGAAKETMSEGMHEEGQSVDQEIQAENAHSAVVPNAVLMGPDGKPPKEGDEIVVKVIKNFGDESEVTYAPAKPKTPGHDMMPPGANEEIEALDEHMT